VAAGAGDAAERASRRSGLTAAPSPGSRPPIAVTGATGFIGRHVLAAIAATGRPARVLARDPRVLAPSPTCSIIAGGLADKEALESLTDGVAAVIHCAGVIAAPNRAAFRVANVDGTGNLLRATPTDTRVVHVSSLAARRPALSAYGDSKREAELLVLADERHDRIVVRPPAVYGPGDRATLPVFQQLVRGMLVVPAQRAARFSLLFVEDLARLLVALALGTGAPAEPLEPDDGCAAGYGWNDLATIAGAATGRRVRLLRLPPVLAWPVAWGSELVARVSGGQPLLSCDKLRELSCPEWLCRAGDLAVDWRPSVQFAAGFPATLAWYRREGWL
jgi:nucleoside-diphosphate-sugar epimerase